MKNETGNFKVRCVENVTDFIVGKEYQVKDGKFKDDSGYTFDRQGRGYKNVAEINDCLSSQFELVTEPKPFTKSDLRTGMRVKTRNGAEHIVFAGLFDNRLIFKRELDYWFSDIGMDETMSHSEEDSIFDIVQVFDSPGIPKLLNFKVKGELLYKRIEPTYITIPEAEAMLSEVGGKEIKIRKE